MDGPTTMASDLHHHHQDQEQWHTLIDEDVAHCLCQFIGKCQYRFIAPINRKWHDTYIQSFPDTTGTYYNVSSTECIKLSLDESPMNDISLILKAAARNGSLHSLKYLLSIGSQDISKRTEEMLCVEAASNGHINVLRYLFKRKSGLSDQLCENTAQNGNLRVLQDMMLVLRSMKETLLSLFVVQLVFFEGVGNDDDGNDADVCNVGISTITCNDADTNK